VARHVVREDALDDRSGLRVWQPAVAVGDRLPARVDASRQHRLAAVAVRQAARRHGPLDPATEASVRVRAKLHEVLLVHHAQDLRAHALEVEPGA
jgi:hypothetical protein